MSEPLRVGLVRTETVSVDRARTIGFLGEENRVYSTPSMVNDVEYACWRLLESHIPSEQTSLGVQVSMQHLAATPMNEDVTVTVRVEAVNGARVHFSAELRDCTGTIGRAEHERALVNRARHCERLAKRRADAAPGKHQAQQ